MQIHYKNREQERTFTFLTTVAELTAQHKLVASIGNIR